MSKTSVKDAIRALSEKGLVEIVGRSLDGVNLPNQYMLSLGVGFVATEGGACGDSGVGRVAATNLEVKPINKPNTYTPLARLVSLSVDEAIAKDWLEIRKAKKLPLTDTALRGVIREAQKAKMELNDVIRTCCERGWGSFSAGWLEAQGGRATFDDWFKTNEGIERKARECGITARGGESHQALRNRIESFLRQQGGKAA